MFRKHHKIILIVAILSVIFLWGNIVFAQEAETPKEIEGPKLQMPIPDVPQLSKIQVKGEKISVPWIAEYIAGVYKYGVALAVSLTIFMLMAGGFFWITAAGEPKKIDKARTIITDAVIGLILALGSYLILFTINPDLVKFKAIQLKLVKGELWETTVDLELATITTDTGSAGEVMSTSVFTAPNAACPITFTESQPDSKKMQVSPRSLEFIQKIASGLTTETTPEKIRKIGMAARDCAVSLGSCGKTTSVIQTIAIQGGESGEECYRGKGVRGADCVDAASIKSISTKLSKWINSVNCCLYNSKFPEACKQTPCVESGVSNKEASKKIVIAKLSAESDMSGWPESWLNLLQPGDEIVVYNANDSYSGGHSVTFLGWKNFNNKVAIVVSASWGSPVKINETNLKNAILRKITRPQY